MSSTAIRTRRALIDKLVERLVVEFGKQRVVIDVERLESIVEIWLPASYVELQAEMDEESREEEREIKRGPTSSILDELRAVLGYDKSISIVGLIKGAVDAIREAKDEKRVTRQANSPTPGRLP